MCLKPPNKKRTMMTVGDIWQTSLGQLREMLNEDTFNRWIAGIVPVRREENTVILGVSCDIFSDWLSLNYKDIIERVVREVSASDELEIVFESGHEPPAARSDAPTASPISTAAPAPPIPAAAPAPAPPGGTEKALAFNRRFSFDTFVVGDNNRFAHAACLAVAAAPGTVYNPLFMHSPTGLGKTHLMQATAQELLQHSPAARVEYISSEEFSNGYIDAIKRQGLSEFRRHYRNVDLLLIDDVQFFAGKEGLQQEFFHTFNALYNSHKQIVLTSDRPPHEIGGLEKRLVSRFEWGLATDIGSPDLETRMAILKRKQDDHVVKLGDDVLFLIASRIKSNIRRLEGALIRLVSYSSVTGKKLSQEEAERLLEPLLDEEATSLITIEKIQRTVAEFYDIRLADMSSKRRPQNIAWPRQVAMYLCRELTDYSSPAIAECFSRNHATILHAEQSVRERAEQNPDIRREVNILRRRIRG